MIRSLHAFKSVSVGLAAAALLSLAPSPTQASPPGSPSERDGTRGGGDLVRLRFFEIGLRNMAHLRTPKGLAFARKFGLDLDKLERTLSIHVVQVVDPGLVDRTRSAVDATGIQGSIQLDREEWKDHLYHGQDLRLQVLHEMLRGAGYNDDDFVISRHSGLGPLPEGPPKSLFAQVKALLPELKDDQSLVIGRIVGPAGEPVRIAKIESESTFRAPKLLGCADLMSIAASAIGLGGGIGPTSDEAIVTVKNTAKIVNGSIFAVRAQLQHGPGYCGFRSDGPTFRITAYGNDPKPITLWFSATAAVKSDKPEIAEATVDPSETGLSNAKVSAPLALSSRMQQYDLFLSGYPKTAAQYFENHGLVTPPAFSSDEISFKQLREQVYAWPKDPAQLPALRGAGMRETIKAFLGSISQRISSSMTRTLISRSSTKEHGIKAFHPNGVCAEARWKITRDTVYSGLFEENTDVPALVRLSTGGNSIGPKAEYGIHRNFGLAIKLFPGPNPGEAVLPRNILNFDQSGLDGNPSAWALRNHERDEKSTQFFTNWMFGDSLIANSFDSLFSLFSDSPRLRSLVPVASVTGDNQPVDSPRAPKFIKFLPVARRMAPTADFRTELLAYKPGEILFKVAVVYGDDPAMISASTPNLEVIGELTLGQPVVSDFCDQDLHFSHAPN